MWVPELPFQLACRREQGLQGRPLAFLGPRPERTPVLWLVNRMARAEGLVPGMPMDQALRRVRGLQVLDPAPQTWWEAQASLGEFLLHWSPQGQLGRMGEALLELGGTSRLLGPPQDAAARIQRELVAQVGWTSHGGLSRSATAARLAAHLERQLEWVQEGAEQAFLAPHGLTRMPDLSSRLHERLRRFGLSRFGDIQPLPLPTLAQFMPEPEARRLLTRARGEDRPRLPLLADPPGSSRHPWRLEPPRLPEEVTLASWCLERLWSEGRSPRTLQLRWWDVDGLSHQWSAPGEMLALPSMELAQAAERAFRQLSVRRILVHRLELQMAWGLGKPRSLFEEPRVAKLHALEPILERLRRRYPAHPVLPGWVRGTSP